MSALLLVQHTFEDFRVGKVGASCLERAKEIPAADLGKYEAYKFYDCFAPKIWEPCCNTVASRKYSRSGSTYKHALGSNPQLSLVVDVPPHWREGLLSKRRPRKVSNQEGTL
jgi:hypothetical protein